MLYSVKCAYESYTVSRLPSAAAAPDAQAGGRRPEAGDPADPADPPTPHQSFEHPQPTTVCKSRAV